MILLFSWVNDFEGILEMISGDFKVFSCDFAEDSG